MRRHKDLILTALLKLLLKKKIISMKELSEEIRRIRKVDREHIRTM